jgi:RNA polymerase sigma-70 factor (ECF subfamily)
VRGSDEREGELRWERRCLERARAGEREAFAELYRAFAPRLYSQVLMPKLGNRQAAEDALSETFRTLLERREQVEVRERSLFHWLARVAANKAIDMHRVKARTGRALTSFEGLVSPLREHTGPDVDMEQRDLRARVQQGVERVLPELNPRYRRAIELRFFEEHSRERCAELMEVKLGTFDVLLLRALRAFRKRWEAETAAAGGEA